MSELKPKAHNLKGFIQDVEALKQRYPEVVSNEPYVKKAFEDLKDHLHKKYGGEKEPETKSPQKP